MRLPESLAELEGLQFPEIEARAIDRLRHFVEASGGLPIERDCESREILAVGDDDMRETLLPLCRWVIGLTTHLQGGRAGGVDCSCWANLASSYRQNHQRIYTRAHSVCLNVVHCTICGRFCIPSMKVFGCLRLHPVPPLLPLLVNDIPAQTQQ